MWFMHTLFDGVVLITVIGLIMFFVVGKDDRDNGIW